jgi:hypothetical protein
VWLSILPGQISDKLLHLPDKERLIPIAQETSEKLGSRSDQKSFSYIRK